MSSDTDRTALGLSALLGTAAVAHLAAPHVFDAALPDWLPGRKRDWAVGSGFAELACAALVAHPRSRRAGGYAAAALFVAVFPGNLHMAAEARSPRARAVTLLRLPLQVPLVWWGWRVGRHA